MEVETSMQRRSFQFTKKEINGIKLIHKNDRVLVPKESQQRLLNCYHKMLCHPGSVKHLQTMKSVFTWKNMQKDIKTLYKYCHTCQMNEKMNKNKYGKLPEKLAESIKW